MDRTIELLSFQVYLQFQMPLGARKIEPELLMKEGGA